MRVRAVPLLVVIVLWGSGLGTFAEPNPYRRIAGRAQPGRGPQRGSRVGVEGPASNWTLPRTAWGDPDLSGTWNYATMTPLERPQGLAGKSVFTDEEAAAFERQTIERQSVTNNTAGPDWWDPGTRHLMNRRTSLILVLGEDEQLHLRVLENAALRDEFAQPDELGLDLPPFERLSELDELAQIDDFLAQRGWVVRRDQFFQFRDHVVIFNEMIHDARIVPMDGRPRGNVQRWMGEARGRWAADTLVVDTINFTDKTNFRGSGEHLHLIERFTRVRDDTVEYEFTAEDPTTWTRPWTASISLTKTEGPVFEYACHEGNARSVEGILRGARTQDGR